MLLKVRTVVSLGAGVISNLGEHDSDVSVLIISLSWFRCWWHGSVCDASRSYSLMSSLLKCRLWKFKESSLWMLYEELVMRGEMARGETWPQLGGYWSRPRKRWCGRCSLMTVDMHMWRHIWDTLEFFISIYLKSNSQHQRFWIEPKVWLSFA